MNISTLKQNNVVIGQRYIVRYQGALPYPYASYLGKAVTILKQHNTDPLYWHIKEDPSLYFMYNELAPAQEIKNKPDLGGSNE